MITDSKTGRFVRIHAVVFSRCPCGMPFSTTQDRIDYGRGKYCSKPCLYRFRVNAAAEDHPRWKGAEAKYSAIHKWVATAFGQPMECEWCGFASENRYQIQWANRSGKYKRVREDWVRLCARCHWHFDREGLEQI